MYLVKEHKLSIRQACNTINIARSSLYYQPKEKNDTEVIDLLNHLAQKDPRNGFRKLFLRICNSGAMYGVLNGYIVSINSWDSISGVR